MKEGKTQLVASSSKESEEEKAAALKDPELWKKNNEWLDKLINFLEKSDPQEAQQIYEKVEKFIKGELSWAQVKGIPPQVLLEIAGLGYLQYQSKRYKEAEIIFQGLAFLDDAKGYYHTMLGAIYQKTNRAVDAIVEYGFAIDLNPEDVSAYVNRGEIYYELGFNDEPLEDFNKAIALDPSGKNPQVIRAQFLKDKLLREIDLEKR